MLQITCETANVQETENIGNAIGAYLKGGETIELVADIGGGKTAFTRGLVSGAGSKDHVSSPTFTVSKVYTTPEFEIHHFDFYRLNEPGVVTHELAEVVEDSKAVVVVEWAQTVQDVLQPDHLIVTFQSHPTETDSRTITISGPDSLTYLIGDVPCSDERNT